MSKKRVLWIEDDQAQFWPIVKRLNRKGINVTASASLTDAEHQIKSARTRPFDLIIVDNVLPDDRSDVQPDESNHNIGIDFVKGLKSTGEYEGRVMVLSFFLPEPPEQEKIKQQIGEVKFRDKNSLRLDTAVSEIEGLVTDPAD